MLQHLKQLEHAIETLWREGLALTPEAQHYIDSTLLNPSLPDLKNMLCDETNCEKDSLLELILFPDQTFQVKLEDLLEGHDFGTEDEEKLSRALIAKRLQTTLLFSAGRGSLNLAVPDWAIGRFISRLNITKKLDPALMDAIRHYVPRPYQALCKVKLRSTRFKFTPNKISFLNVFFKKMKAEFGIDFSAYDFLLAFLDELKDDTDLYRALTQKKRFYFQNLQKAERYSAQLKNSNMETLLLQGVRIPYFNTEEARRRMDLIDRICYTVFGQSNFLATGGSTDLGEFSRKNGLEAVFKILS